MELERLVRVRAFFALAFVAAALGCTGRERGDDDDDDDDDVAGDDAGGLHGRDAGPGDGDAGPDDPADAAVPDEPCDPSRPFGAPTMDESLSENEVSEPWITGDGLTVVVTHVTEDFGIELQMSSRARRRDPFPAPATVTLGSFSEWASQSSLSPDGDALFFMSGAEILRAAATGTPGMFADPEVVDAAFPEYTDYPEYPRAAAGGIYFSLRELNQRRSLYVHDPERGTTEAILYDAGDIFTIAVSPNGRFVYVTFSVDTLETYRAERASPDDRFSSFEPVPALSLDDPNLIGFAVTGVTDDDCEVYGWTYDLSGTDSIWRAVRGAP
jgi:hypothetical protein